jgi:hypothetical protein
MLFYIRSIIVVCAYCCLNVAFAYGVNVHATSPVHKPQSPIQIILEPDTEVTAGDLLAFNIIVTSMVAADEVNVSIELPVGSQLLEGKLNWQGALEKDEQTSLYLRVKLPENPTESVIASAAIGKFESSQFSARAIYQPTSSLITYTAAATEEKSRVVRRNDKTIAEYELR